MGRQSSFPDLLTRSDWMPGLLAQRQGPKSTAGVKLHAHTRRPSAVWLVALHGQIKVQRYYRGDPGL